MPEPDKPFAKSDEERAAFFQELMREERRRNDGPTSELAVFTLIWGVVCAVGGLFSGLVGVMFLGATLVSAIGGIIQIRHHGRRGIPFIVAGVALAAAWAVWITVVLP